jgi:hypothetical protein
MRAPDRFARSASRPFRPFHPAQPVHELLQEVSVKPSLRTPDITLQARSAIGGASVGEHPTLLDFPGSADRPEE